MRAFKLAGADGRRKGLMDMLKTLCRYIGNYRRDSLLTPLYTALEVLMEILIPFVTAAIIDRGIEARHFAVWRNHPAVRLPEPRVRRPGRHARRGHLRRLCLQPARRDL